MAVSTPNSPREVTHIPLAGLRIGFYTSVVGHGGSEVMFADVMEAACQAGAEVICWSHPDAAIRHISDKRHNTLTVNFRDWPMRKTSELPGNSGLPLTGPSHLSLHSRLWRQFVPDSVKRMTGFLRTAHDFTRELRQVRLDLLFVNVNGSEAVALAGRHWRHPALSSAITFWQHQLRVTYWTVLRIGLHVRSVCGPVRLWFTFLARLVNPGAVNAASPVGVRR